MNAGLKSTPSFYKGVKVRLKEGGDCWLGTQSRFSTNAFPLQFATCIKTGINFKYEKPQKAYMKRLINLVKFNCTEILQVLHSNKNSQTSVK